MNAALDRRAREHFEALTRTEVEAAIRRMALEGFSPDVIARATRLSVEEIRRVLAEAAA